MRFELNGPFYVAAFGRIKGHAQNAGRFLARHGHPGRLVTRGDIGGDEFPYLVATCEAGNAKFIRIIPDDLACRGQFPTPPGFAGDINDTLRDMTRGAE